MLRVIFAFIASSRLGRHRLQLCDRRLRRILEARAGESTSPSSGRRPAATTSSPPASRCSAPSSASRSPRPRRRCSSACWPGSSRRTVSPPRIGDRSGQSPRAPATVASRPMRACATADRRPPRRRDDRLPRRCPLSRAAGDPPERAAPRPSAGTRDARLDRISGATGRRRTGGRLGGAHGHACVPRRHADRGGEHHDPVAHRRAAGEPCVSKPSRRRSPTPPGRGRCRRASRRSAMAGRRCARSTPARRQARADRPGPAPRSRGRSRPPPRSTPPPAPVPTNNSACSRDVRPIAGTVGHEQRWRLTRRRPVMTGGVEGVVDPCQRTLDRRTHRSPRASSGRAWCGRVRARARSAGRAALPADPADGGGIRSPSPPDPLAHTSSKIADSSSR